MANWGTDTSIWDFGNVTIGTTKTETRYVYNYSTSYRNYNLSSSDSARFTLNVSSISVPPNVGRPYQVTFHPIAAQAYDATITVDCTSTACDPSLLTVPVHGHGTGGVTYTLTVTIDPFNTGEVWATGSDGSNNLCDASPCHFTYVAGTTVDLMAAPYSGQQFYEWQGACTGTSPTGCSITMSANRSVVAAFSSTPDDPFMDASFSWSGGTQDPVVGCTLTASYLWGNVTPYPSGTCDSVGNNCCVILRLYKPYSGPPPYPYCEEWTTNVTGTCQNGLHNLHCYTVTETGIYKADGWFWNGTSYQEMTPVYIEVFAAPPSGCVNPVGAENAVICGQIGTTAPIPNHKYQCTNTDWVDIETCPYGCVNGECQAEQACTNPVGAENEIICGIQGTDAPEPNQRYQCVSAIWHSVQTCENTCDPDTGECVALPLDCNLPEGYINDYHCGNPLLQNTPVTGHQYHCETTGWVDEGPNDSCQATTPKTEWMKYLPYALIGAGALIVTLGLMKPRLR